MFTSQAIRNSTDGGTIDGDANKVNSGGPHSVQHQATGGSGGATATAADAAAGPSAATTTDKPSTSFLDDKTADKCNDTTPELSTADVAMVATSSSTGATVSSAKSSNDAAVGSSGPSPSTSSSEEWHSASSRLQRAPFSSDENSSSFYATPGTSSTSTTAEAGNRTGTSSGSSTSIELPSTSDDGKMTAPRKRLQWTPPPSAENKVRRMMEGDPICNKITLRSMVTCSRHSFPASFRVRFVSAYGMQNNLLIYGCYMSANKSFFV